MLYSKSRQDMVHGVNDGDAEQEEAEELEACGPRSTAKRLQHVLHLQVDAKNGRRVRRERSARAFDVPDDLVCESPSGHDDIPADPIGWSPSGHEI
jgi:hypothetical protein